MGNEVIYVQTQKDGEKTTYKKYIRHFLSDDITQDSTQAYAQMKITNKWAVEEKGAKLLMYLEDGASQHYKNANAEGDKRKEAQELKVPIITFWSCTDDGKCEVDGAGKACANAHKDVLVPKAVERAEDPVDCEVLVDVYNEACRYPEHQSKGSPLDYREAFHLDPSVIETLRASRPAFATRVFALIFTL